MLFGSWAKGAEHEESDVDVALISDVFTGDRFQDRRKIVPLR
ncbi:MAG: nucleotidyltransferase domain-containing protein, partial [Deltaproteobacteria bacterium]|nr:nucleotidyltransferase domain-containing protein [Deltaproteobacteria bacterium]